MSLVVLRLHGYLAPCDTHVVVHGMSGVSSDESGASVCDRGGSSMAHGEGHGDDCKVGEHLERRVNLPYVKTIRSACVECRITTRLNEADLTDRTHLLSVGIRLMIFDRLTKKDGSEALYTLANQRKGNSSVGWGLFRSFGKRRHSAERKNLGISLSRKTFNCNIQ